MPTPPRPWRRRAARRTAIRDAARAEGESDAAAVLSAKRARDRRQARAIVLAAQREAYDELRSQVVQALSAIRDDPGYGPWRDRLAEHARTRARGGRRGERGPRRRGARRGERSASRATPWWDSPTSVIDDDGCGRRRALVVCEGVMSGECPGYRARWSSSRVWPGWPCMTSCCSVSTGCREKSLPSPIAGSPCRRMRTPAAWPRVPRSLRAAHHFRRNWARGCWARCSTDCCARCPGPEPGWFRARRRGRHRPTVAIHSLGRRRRHRVGG